MSQSSSAQPTRWLLISVVIPYLILGMLYALFTPHWQAPDEPAHYNYAKYLAEQHRFPILKVGDYPEAYLQEIKDARFPPEMSIAPIRYEFHQPPLYYLLAVPVYQVFDGELLPLRLLSVAIGALLLFVIYWIVLEVAPTHPHLALGATAFVAFLPMHLAMTAAANNDTLAELLQAIILLLAIRYLKSGSRPDESPGAESRLLVLLGVTTGLALINKSSNYVAVPLVLLAIAAKHIWLNKPQLSLVGGFKAAVLFLLPTVALALPWWLRNMAIYGGFDFLGLGRHEHVVAGQLTPAEYIASHGTAGWLRDMALTSFRSFWGQFGWMGVLMDQRIYQALAILSGLALVGFVMWLVRAWSRRAKYPDWQRASGLLLALSGLFTLASFFWYNISQFVQPQGRYLFPALAPISLAVALGWHEAVRHERALSMAALLLISAAGLKVIGWLPNWPLLMLVLAAGAFAVRRFLPDRWDPIVQVCPYLLLIPLNLAALFLFIVPQLTL